jgi:hypothetical protein
MEGSGGKIGEAEGAFTIGPLNRRRSGAQVELNLRSLVDGAFGTFDRSMDAGGGNTGRGRARAVGVRSRTRSLRTCVSRGREAGNERAKQQTRMETHIARPPRAARRASLMNLE